MVEQSAEESRLEKALKLTEEGKNVATFIPTRQSAVQRPGHDVKLPNHLGNIQQAEYIWETEMGKGKSRGKGMRRSYLKNFSAGMINGGQGVDKRYTDQFKNTRRSMGKVQQGPTIDLMEDGRPILPKIVHPDLTPPKPRAHYTEAGTYISGTSPQRRDVELELRRLKLEERINTNWTGGQRHQKIETLPKVLMTPKAKYTKIWLYHGTDHFVFVEETLWAFRCSITYTNRSRAMRAFAEEKIVWVETQEREISNAEDLHGKTGRVPPR